MQQPPQRTPGSGICNVSDYLRINAEMHPEKPALLYPVRITYREMEEMVSGYSFGFLKSGIKAGTRTLVMVEAGADFFELTFALIRIGAIPVMIDPGMGIKAMSTVLSGLEPEAFIGNFKAHLFRLLFPRIFNTVKVKIATGSVSIGGSQRLKDMITINPDRYISHASSANKTAAIFYTSGSTGPAKGVIYTNCMLENQFETTKAQFNIGNDEIDLCTFPLLGLFAICHGNSSVLADMDMVHPAKLDPAKVVKNITDFKCTQMFGSPMILDRLADYGIRKKITLPSLRNIISAGAPVHRNIMESFSKLIHEDAEIHAPYGATEALPVTDITYSEILMISSEGCNYENGICIGKPVKPLEVRIIEITDEPLESWDCARILPVNSVGEITVKGPWVSGGYFRNYSGDRLSKISDNISDETWHRMGDLGKIDVNGILWFYGRKSQRVITSGGTLFTIPCEAVFNRHPHVKRSALVGVEKNSSGIKRAVICIQLKSGFHPDQRLLHELHELGCSNLITRGISDILFKKKFPVDPRHNAKIFREKLALWASKRIR